MKAYKCDFCHKYCDEVKTIYSSFLKKHGALAGTMNGLTVYETELCNECSEKIMAITDNLGNNAPIAQQDRATAF